MILRELFGEGARIKILEELISNWDFFLSVDELSRMSDVSKKSVYTHIEELNKIGILIMDDEGSKKFKLNPQDSRCIALALIESDEYLRKMDEFEKSLSDDEFLTLSVSDNNSNELLKVDSERMKSSMKSIPLINFII